MTDSQLLDLQARQFEDQLLSRDELIELACARKGHLRVARLLHEDLCLHSELMELHRIEATAVQFVERFSQSLPSRFKTATLTAASKSNSEVNQKSLTNTSPFSKKSGGELPLAVKVRTERRRITGSSKRLRRMELLVAVMGVAAMLCVVVAGWMLISKTKTEKTRFATIDKPDPPIDVEENLSFESRVKQLGLHGEADGESEPLKNPRKPSLHVAQLRTTDDAVWEEASPKETIVFPVEYKLRSGVAEVILDDGTELVFQGPADFILQSARDIQLGQGKFRIQPTRSVNKLKITTPSVQFSGNEDLLAFFDVKPEEGTLVQLDRGQLNAMPWDENQGESLRLSAKGLNQGVFSPPWRDDSDQLASAIAMNRDGAFASLLAAGDSPIRIASPELFAQILSTSRTLIKEDPMQFSNQWNAMVENLVNSAAKTDLNVNGRTLRSDNVSDMLQQFTRIREEMDSNDGKETGSKAYSGTLSINGKVQRFSSAEQFHEAQKQMFGPLFGRIMQPFSSLDSGNSGKLFSRVGNETGEKDRKSKLEAKAGQSSTSPVESSEGSQSFFSGSININGQSINFDSPEEFNRAMQRLKPHRRR